MIKIECIFEMKEEIKKKNRVNCKRERACVHAWTYICIFDRACVSSKCVAKIKQIYKILTFYGNRNKRWKQFGKNYLIISLQLLFLMYIHIVILYTIIFEAFNYRKFGFLWIMNLIIKIWCFHEYLSHKIIITLPYLLIN